VRALQGVWEGVRAAVSVGALPGAAGAGAGGGGASVSIPPPPIPRRSGMTLFEAMDESPPPQPRGGGGGGGWLSSLFGGGGGDGEGGAPSPSSPSSFTAAPPGVPRGLYMHGGVGTGKTMLMDLFVEAVGGVAPVSGWRKERERRGALSPLQARARTFSSLSPPPSSLFLFTPAMTRRHSKLQLLFNLTFWPGTRCPAAGDACHRQPSGKRRKKTRKKK